MTVPMTTLANGLRVLTDPMSTVESASVGVWIGVGARHETVEVNGVSHLLEHMAFKGTRRRNARAISPAMGYNQLLTTNSLSMLSEHGG